MSLSVNWLKVWVVEQYVPGYNGHTKCAYTPTCDNTFYDYSIYMGYMLVSMLIQSDFIINADYNGCLSMHTLGVQTIKIAGIYYKESNCGSINLR